MQFFKSQFYGPNQPQSDLAGSKTENLISLGQEESRDTPYKAK